MDRIHEELCVHPRPSNLTFPAWIVLCTVSKLFAFEDAFSYDILLQIVLIEQLFLLEQLGQLARQEICVNLYAQKELLLFLIESFAQHSSLDLILSCFDTSLRDSPCGNASVNRTFQNFLFQSPMLPFLEDTNIGVASVLLTSTRALAS